MELKIPKNHKIKMMMGDVPMVCNMQCYIDNKILCPDISLVWTLYWNTHVLKYESFSFYIIEQTVALAIGLM